MPRNIVNLPGHYFEAGTSPYYQRRIEHYKDKGCALHPSCLECPEDPCVHDNPEHLHVTKLARDAEIKKLYDEGKRVDDLMELYHLCRKTVRTIVKAKRYSHV